MTKLHHLVIADSTEQQYRDDEPGHELKEWHMNIVSRCRSITHLSLDGGYSSDELLKFIQSLKQVTSLRSLQLHLHCEIDQLVLDQLMEFASLTSIDIPIYIDEDGTVDLSTMISAT